MIQSWEPRGKKETSFRRGETQSTRLKELFVENFHFDNFEYIDEKLYYKGNSTALMIKGGKLRSFGEITKILGKERLRELGFDIPRGKTMAQQAIKLNRFEEEMPSKSDVAKADDIGLQEITKNATRSMENFIGQLEGESSEDFPCVNS